MPIQFEIPSEILETSLDQYELKKRTLESTLKLLTMEMAAGLSKPTAIRVRIETVR